MRKSVTLSVAIDGKPIVLTPTGIKSGAKGRVTDPAQFLASIPDKGVRRKIRKESRRLGRIDIAAAR